MAVKINIKGPIISSSDQWVYDWLGIEATSPKSVNKQLEKANREDVEVEINSVGGSIFAASEIYTVLKTYIGKVIVKIVGLAASAASVIAMAGDVIQMSPTAQMMIHNVSAKAAGDYREMEHTAEILRNANQTIINAYRLRTGKSDEELQALMDKEAWMTAQQALENKFIDEIMFQDDNLQLVACFEQAVMLPQEAINKIKSFRHPLNEADIFIQQKAEAQLKLLRLGGKDIG
jgi:ATP-dependent Clp protease protease subunit